MEKMFWRTFISKNFEKFLTHRVLKRYEGGGNSHRNNSQAGTGTI